MPTYFLVVWIAIEGIGEFTIIDKKMDNETACINAWITELQKDRSVLVDKHSNSSHPGYEIQVSCNIKHDHESPL